MIIDIVITMNAAQQIFTDQWLISRNATRAYRFAYPKCKTDNAASTAGERLLRKVDIKAYIDKKLNKISDKAALTVQRVLEEEGYIVLSDMRKIFDKNTIISPSELPEDVARAIKSVVVTEKNIFHIDGNAEIITTYKYSFWDKGAALNRVEKYLGMHTEKIDLTTDGETINTPEETLRRFAFMLRNKEEGDQGG